MQLSREGVIKQISYKANQLQTYVMMAYCDQTATVIFLAFELFKVQNDW